RPLPRDRRLALAAHEHGGAGRLHARSLVGARRARAAVVVLAATEAADHPQDRAGLIDRDHAMVAQLLADAAEVIDRLSGAVSAQARRTRAQPCPAGKACGMLLR